MIVFILSICGFELVCIYTRAHICKQIKKEYAKEMIRKGVPKGVYGFGLLCLGLVHKNCVVFSP